MGETVAAFCPINLYGIVMKAMIKRVVLLVLMLLMMVVSMAVNMLRLRSTVRLARYAYWKVYLAGLGEGSVIYPHVVIHGPEHTTIGNRCSLAEFVHIWGGGGVTIGDDVLIASHTVITSLTHHKKVVRFRETLIKEPVVIMDNVWIGAGAIILPGVTVGEGSIIGAGAVVTSDVAPGVIVAGVPARVIKQRGYQDDCTQRNNGEPSVFESEITDHQRREV